MIKDFYKNKTVLVTGHTGFKGAWLTIWLKMLGARVIGLALESDEEKSLYNLCNIGTQIKDYIGDIWDRDLIKKIFQENSIDIVFHLAAQPLVSEGYRDPVTTYKSNLIGTQNILEEMRCTSGKITGIFITTDKVYENKESFWGYREEDPIGGYDPYSSSKACCEILINSYRQSFFNVNDYDKHGKSIASARAGNVIGGGDWAINRIIPDLIRAYENDEELYIRNPRAIRPWQHVLEALSGYMVLGEKLYDNPSEYAEPWNFGPKTMEIYRVKDVCESVNALLNNSIKVKYENVNNFHETSMLCLDITKSCIKLGWKPNLTFNRAIEMTVEWYLKYKECPLDICEKQIKEVMEVME